MTRVWRVFLVVAAKANPKKNPVVHFCAPTDNPHTRKVSHVRDGFVPPPLLLFSLQVIQKRRSEKTEVRAAARDAALR